MEEPWTILELAELAADALAAGQPTGSSAGAGARDGGGPPAGGGSSAEAGSPVGRGSPAGPRAGSSGGGGTPAGAARPAPARANGRVRDVPNERLVRWYVTVGLVDPPLSRRGRVARYGRRHLLQLVAVKRRQAEGRSLAEIQAELAGATDETLAAVARVPDTQPAPDVLPAPPARFWTRSAAQRDPAAAEGAWGAESGRRGRGGKSFVRRARRSGGSRGEPTRARSQARVGSDAAARGRGPRAEPGRCDRNPERRAGAAGGTGQQTAARTRPGASG